MELKKAVACASELFDDQLKLLYSSLPLNEITILKKISEIWYNVEKSVMEQINLSLSWYCLCFKAIEKRIIKK